MKPRDLDGFARLCAALDAPFAARADLLEGHGLEGGAEALEASFAELAAAWGEHLVATPGAIDAFVRAYAAGGEPAESGLQGNAALVVPPGGAELFGSGEPRPREVPSFALGGQCGDGGGVQATREVDVAALQRLVVPFRPGPASLVEGARSALPASDGDTLPMPSAPASRGYVPGGAGPAELRGARRRLSWREHATLRAAIDVAPRRVAELLRTARLDAGVFAEEEQAWRERLARDPILRAQWRAAYEHAAAKR